MTELIYPVVVLKQPRSYGTSVKLIVMDFPGMVITGIIDSTDTTMDHLVKSTQDMIASCISRCYIAGNLPIPVPTYIHNVNNRDTIIHVTVDIENIKYRRAIVDSIEYIDEIWVK